MAKFIIILAVVALAAAATAQSTSVNANVNVNGGGIVNDVVDAGKDVISVGTGLAGIFQSIGNFLYQILLGNYGLVTWIVWFLTEVVGSTLWTVLKAFNVTAALQQVYSLLSTVAYTVVTLISNIFAAKPAVTLNTGVNTS